MILVVVTGNLLLWHQLSSVHAARVSLMGETIGSQLALSIQEPMVRGEHLTINVMLNDLLAGSQGLIAYASVYNNDNTLIAQAGALSPDLELYANRISYQQSVIGRLQIGLGGQPANAIYQPLVTLLLLQAALVILITLGLGLFVNVIMFWLYPDLATRVLQNSDLNETASEPPDLSDRPSMRHDGTLMIVRPIPLKLEPEIIEMMRSAVSMCHGELRQVGAGDLELLFQSDHHEQDAVCCAALLSELVGTMPRPYSAHFALHYCTDCESSNSQFTEARKFTNYLTAVAGGKVLISHTLALRVPDTLGVRFSSFSHTALPNGQAMVMDGSTRSFQSAIRQRLELLSAQ